MSSYLTPGNYILWIVFIVLEIVLFFKLRTVWLRPIKYFMGYAAVRDVFLLMLTPKPLLYEYFVIYWLSQMVSLTWFAYISGCIIKQLLPSTPRLVYLLPSLGVVFLCVWNFSLNNTAKLYIMQTHCLLISISCIVGAMLFNLSRQHSNIILSVVGLLGTGLFTAWVWMNLGYQPLLGETAWIAALLGVVVAVNSQQRLKPLTALLQPSSAVQ